MTTELIQQLKDAGFPLNILTPLYPDVYAEPTLSELIDACYKTNKIVCAGFTLMKQPSSDGTWYARMMGSVVPPEGDFTGTGSTPEEAVIKLYLKLNEEM